MKPIKKLEREIKGDVPFEVWAVNYTLYKLICEGELYAVKSCEKDGIIKFNYKTK
jgi:hypothetical protein